MAGQRIGYIRVSSLEQNTERQLESITLDKIFTDKVSGKDTNRPQLQSLFNYIREGDELYVHSMCHFQKSSSLKSEALFT